MNRNFSIALLVVMASLLIIGFGVTATAEAAGSCAETPFVSVSASESTVFSNCRAFEADAGRYAGLAAFYTPGTNAAQANVQRSFETDAARYTAIAAYYTDGPDAAQANVQRSIEAEAARYTAIAAYYTTQDAYRRWFPGR